MRADNSLKRVNIRTCGGMLLKAGAIIRCALCAFTVLFVFCLSSCKLSEHGDDLAGLLARTNSLCGTSLHAEGFVLDSDNNGYYSFLQSSDGEKLLIYVTRDVKNRIIKCSVTFSDCDISAEQSLFAEKLFQAFSECSPEEVAEHLEKISFYSPADAPSTHALSAECESAIFTLTRTEPGLCAECKLKSP